jgi:hypothetical protein
MVERRNFSHLDGWKNVKRDGQMEKMDGWTTNTQIYQPE